MPGQRTGALAAGGVGIAGDGRAKPGKHTIEVAAEGAAMSERQAAILAATAQVSFEATLRDFRERRGEFGDREYIRRLLEPMGGASPLQRRRRARIARICTDAFVSTARCEPCFLQE